MRDFFRGANQRAVNTLRDAAAFHFGALANARARAYARVIKMQTKIYCDECSVLLFVAVVSWFRRSVRRIRARGHTAWQLISITRICGYKSGACFVCRIACVTSGGLFLCVCCRCRLRL